MTRMQQLATALLAVLIVASVMAMPRTVDLPRERPATRTAAADAQAPAASAELNHEQVKDLTYN